MLNYWVKNNEHRGPVKLWECQEPHYAKYCSNRKGKFNNLHTIQEKETVEDVENEMPRINASLENQHVDHQTSMVEVQGMIQNQSISIFIDPCGSLNYISPSIVEKCSLYLKKFEKSSLVQLATRTKRKVVNYVENVICL